MKNVPYLIILAIGLCGCRQQQPAPPVSQPAAPTETYTPGLGEIMTLQQMRHTKLWLAGEAQNWALASYEMDELAEGFDDVLKFHPTHEGSPVAPKDAIPRIIAQPLADLRATIEKKDLAAFESGYDALTAGCNSCHNAMNFGFNVVQRPANNPYPNQIFQVLHK